jgi:hypothetical protein
VKIIQGESLSKCRSDARRVYGDGVMKRPACPDVE